LERTGSGISLRQNHRNRKFVKSGGVTGSGDWWLPGMRLAGVLVTVSCLGWGGWRWRGCRACRGAGLAVPGRLCAGWPRVSWPAAGSRRALASLRSPQPGSPWPGGRVPTARNRARCKGRGGAARGSERAGGSTHIRARPAAGGRPAGFRAVSRRGRPARSSPHAAAGAVTARGRAGMAPEAIRGSQALPSLSNFLCKLGQSLSFCYLIRVISGAGQTGTRSPNATANAFMAAFQPYVPVPRSPRSRISPSPSICRPVIFLIPR
jgi:hypothetical protein